MAGAGTFPESLVLAVVKDYTLQWFAAVMQISRAIYPFTGAVPDGFINEHGSRKILRRIFFHHGPGAVGLVRTKHAGGFWRYGQIM